MKKMPLVSVIVPVYNVENYLQECINSIINQTYKNIEILLVDDGSTDLSGNICDNYTCKYDFILTFHKKNGGLSSARNFGIDKSNGQYLLFIDSDDYILPNMITKLCDMCETNKTKIAACNYFNVYNDKIECVKESKEEKVYTSRAFFKKILTENGRIEMCAVNKMYHKSVFNNNDNRFPEGKLFEDLGSMYKFIFSVNKISYIDEGYYCYRRARQGSITATWNGKREFDRINMANNMIDFIHREVPSLYKDAVTFKYMNSYLTSINSMINTSHFDDKIYSIAKEDILSHLTLLMESDLPNLKKIQIIIAVKSYRLYQFIYKSFSGKD